MTETYVLLIAGGVPTRRAAVLTGMVRSTATRRRNAATSPTPAVAAQPALDPVNKLTELERRRVLEVLNSDRFVDLAPLQIYAQLLDEGVYLCSVSTMYRVGFGPIRVWMNVASQLTQHVGVGGGESFGQHGGQVDIVGSGHRVCSFFARVTLTGLSKNHAMTFNQSATTRRSY